MEDCQQKAANILKTCGGKDTAPHPDCSRTNSIMVFNLQPPPLPATPSGGAHSLCELMNAWRDQNHVAHTHLDIHPQAQLSSRRLMFGRPEFAEDEPLPARELLPQPSMRQVNMQKPGLEADSDLRGNGGLSGWMHRQGLQEYQSSASHHYIAGNMMVRSSGRQFDREYQQVGPTDSQRDVPYFAQKVCSDPNDPHASQSHGVIRPSHQESAAANKMGASQGAEAKVASESGRKMMPVVPLRVVPVNLTENMFRSKDNTRNFQEPLGAEGDQADKMLISRASQMPNCGPDSVQYFVPVNMRGDQNIQYIKPMKASLLAALSGTSMPSQQQPRCLTDDSRMPKTKETSTQSCSLLQTHSSLAHTSLQRKPSSDQQTENTKLPESSNQPKKQLPPCKSERSKTVLQTPSVPTDPVHTERSQPEIYTEHRAAGKINSDTPVVTPPRPKPIRSASLEKQSGCSSAKTSAQKSEKVQQTKGLLQNRERPPVSSVSDVVCLNTDTTKQSGSALVPASVKTEQAQLSFNESHCAGRGTSGTESTDLQRSRCKETRRSVVEEQSTHQIAEYDENDLIICMETPDSVPPQNAAPQARHQSTPCSNPKSSEKAKSRKDLQNITGNVEMRQTESTSEQADSDEDVLIIDVEEPDDAVTKNQEDEEPEVTCLEQSLSISAQRAPEKVRSNEECGLGIKILETVSLADLQPSAQSVCLRHLSSKGFYRCGCLRGQCPFTSQLQAHFESHLLQAHPAESEYPCVHCGSMERSCHDLLFHLDQHLDFQRFILYCTEPSCDFHSYSPESVLSHMAVSHQDLATHVCWHCGLLAASLRDFSAHVKSSLLQVALCPHCDAKDTDGHRMLQHITSQHPRQVRMIAFHKLLVCRERKLSGWNTEVLCSREGAGTTGTAEMAIISGAGSGIAGFRSVAVFAGSVSGPTVSHTASSKDSESRTKGSTSNEADTSGTTDVNDRSVTYSNLRADNYTDAEIRVTSDSVRVAKSGKQRRKTHQGQVETTVDTVTLQKDGFECSSEVSSGDLGKAPDSTKVDATSSKSSAFPDVGKLKLLLRLNKKDPDVLPSKSSIVEPACTSTKMELEPMDYEITASADCSMEVSDGEDTASASGSSTSVTQSASSTSTALGSEQQGKNYSCTVTAAGKAIKIVSKPASSPPLNTAAQPNQTGRRETRERRKDLRQTQAVASKRKLFQCLLCPYTSRLSPGIYQHMYNKHKEILTCPLCHQQTNTRTDLYNHLITLHPADAKTIYKQRKVTNWISIGTPGISKDASCKTGRSSPTKLPTPTRHLDLQDCQVKDYYVLTGQGKERRFQCIFCDYSFKKSQRSSLSVYRSMYKHMFLMHTPCLFQCPLCAYTDCLQDKVKKHLEKDHHHNTAQEPRMLLLPKSGKERLEFYRKYINPDEGMVGETSASDSGSPAAQKTNNMQGDTQSDANIGITSLPECSITLSRPYTPQYQTPPPSQSVFPERVKVSSSTENAFSLKAIAELPSCNTAPDSISSDNGEEDSAAKAALQRPRDFYDVKTMGSQQLFSCLYCSYTTTGTRGKVSARASIIFHVRRNHMHRAQFWRCSVCAFKGRMESRVMKHCQKKHRGKATVIRE